MYFIINNSANSGICNIKSIFVGDFEYQKVTLITTEGKTTTIKKVGTIHLVLKDNAGKKIGHMTYLTLSMIQNHHIAY